MTPAHKAALEWYRDNPGQRLNDYAGAQGVPSGQMAARLIRAGYIELTQDPEWYHDSALQMARQERHGITDLGHRRLAGGDV